MPRKTFDVEAFLAEGPDTPAPAPVSGFNADDFLGGAEEGGIPDGIPIPGMGMVSGQQAPEHGGPDFGDGYIASGLEALARAPGEIKDEIIDPLSEGFTMDPLGAAANTADGLVGAATRGQYQIGDVLGDGVQSRAETFATDNKDQLKALSNIGEGVMGAMPNPAGRLTSPGASGLAASRTLEGGQAALAFSRTMRKLGQGASSPVKAVVEKAMQRATQAEQMSIMEYVKSNPSRVQLANFVNRIFNSDDAGRRNLLEEAGKESKGKIADIEAEKKQRMGAVTKAERHIKRKAEDHRTDEVAKINEARDSEIGAMRDDLARNRSQDATEMALGVDRMFEDSGISPPPRALDEMITDGQSQSDAIARALAPRTAETERAIGGQVASRQAHAPGKPQPQRFSADQLPEDRGSVHPRKESSDRLNAIFDADTDPVDFAVTPDTLRGLQDFGVSGLGKFNRQARGAAALGADIPSPLAGLVQRASADPEVPVRMTKRELFDMVKETERAISADPQNSFHLIPLKREMMNLLETATNGEAKAELARYAQASFGDRITSPIEKASQFGRRKAGAKALSALKSGDHQVIKAFRERHTNADAQLRQGLRDMVMGKAMKGGAPDIDGLVKGMDDVFGSSSNIDPASLADIFPPKILSDLRALRGQIHHASRALADEAAYLEGQIKGMKKAARQEKKGVRKTLADKKADTTNRSEAARRNIQDIAKRKTDEALSEFESVQSILGGNARVAPWVGHGLTQVALATVGGGAYITYQVASLVIPRMVAKYGFKSPAKTRALSRGLTAAVKSRSVKKLTAVLKQIEKLPDGKAFLADIGRLVAQGSAIQAGQEQERF